MGNKQRTAGPLALRACQLFSFPERPNFILAGVPVFVFKKKQRGRLSSAHPTALHETDADWFKCLCGTLDRAPWAQNLIWRITDYE